jgi:hypothetical protein
MLALIEITVSATIRHSETEPIASVATTASVSRWEATGALWPTKPLTLCDRFMVGNSLPTSESPRVGYNRNV